MRFLALSTHRTSIAMKAIRSGFMDAIMFPVNPVHDFLPGDIGLIAMKPYAGGLLLRKGRLSEYMRSRPDVSSGKLSPIMCITLSPVQCLSYALSQPGISTALPGCQKSEEVMAALSYLEAEQEERDFSDIDLNTMWKLRRSCVYCNHCLPCPSEIEIGSLMKLLDAAEYNLNEKVTADYEALTKRASDCTQCGVCIERCPFDVPVLDRMERAIEVFGC